MIDFSVEPEFQAKLDWMAKFVRDECETMDLLWPEQGCQFDPSLKSARDHAKPLQDQVKAQGLWACHLGANLGGPGYGQVKLALMNEIIGRSNWAPVVFGCAAPDTGNAEILALFGTPEQKKTFLPRLAKGAISAFQGSLSGLRSQARFEGLAARAGDAAIFSATAASSAAAATSSCPRSSASG